MARKLRGWMRVPGQVGEGRPALGHKFDERYACRAHSSLRALP